MIGSALTAAVAVVLAALVIPGTATAHDIGAISLGGGGADGAPATVERALGGRVTAMDNGLYRVRSGEGFAYTTHGPDFRLGPRVRLGQPRRADRHRRPAARHGLRRQPGDRLLPGGPVRLPGLGSDQLASKKADIQAMIERQQRGPQRGVAGERRVDRRLQGALRVRRLGQGDGLPGHAGLSGGGELHADRQRGEGSRLGAVRPKGRLLDLLRRPRAHQGLRHGRGSAATRARRAANRSNNPGG